MLEHQWYEVNWVMFEGRKRGEHLQVNFLLLTLIMGVFSIGFSPYGREKFDLGMPFQTSLKLVKYMWV